MPDGDLALEVSDELLAALQRQADANGRTAEEEARVLLIAALESEPDQTADPDGSA